MNNRDVPERFIDERLGAHWKVDETGESFRRLMHHLEIDSNFKPYFQKALDSLKSHHRMSPPKGMVILDMGSGVCWTSALMANHNGVDRVYAVEPSRERLKHAEFVLRHFHVPAGKVILQEGTFTDFQIPEKADCAVLCASLHHCYDEYIDFLFSRIRKTLTPQGVVLIANEHYVDLWFVFQRFLSLIKNFSRRKELFYSLSSLRSPYPHDGEHWRTKVELENLFQRNGFKADFILHDGDLCKENVPFYRKMGYHYYHAILKRMDAARTGKGD